MKKIAINGMGRIGRVALKLLSDHKELEVVAVNDIADIENIAYLLRYDSVHGKFDKSVEVVGNHLVVDGKKIPFFNERDPEQLPWKELGIDVVIESTGVFTNEEDAKKHIKAGATAVALSGPTKSPGVPTVVHGVNTKDGNVSIISCASCTTNNVSPIIEVLNRRLGVKKAILTTIHANTATNRTVDMVHKKNPRMGRSGINNLIPTTTGAAIATTKALPELSNKFDGIAVRVPLSNGSLSDITLVMEKATTVEEINSILLEESNTARYKDIMSASNDPLVSTDIIKSSYASIVDMGMTKVVDGDLVKVLAWYDNEWGFTNQLIRQIS